ARISAVEVRKGSAAVRHGPRTTGGAVNLISTPIPDQPFSGRAQVLLGSDDALLGHAHVGGRGERFGFLLEGVRQQTDGFKDLDGGGDTGYELDDYLAKLSYRTSGASLYQELELKVGRTEQTADETYLGLTDRDFADDPYRRYRASRRDEFDSEHDQLELRHYAALTERLDATTVLYRNEFARNWYKAGAVGGLSLTEVLENPRARARELAWLKGADSPDDAIELRNNNREYTSEGVQTIVGWQPAWSGPARHELELSVRYHEDEEDRFQDDDAYRMRGGRLELTRDGAPGSQANRVARADAWSVYLHDAISVGRWTLTPGLRFESIELTREDYAGDDPGRDRGAVSNHDNRVEEWIPGLGAMYRLNDRVRLLASVHKGFNPPAPGSDADSEQSVNYETGLRYTTDRVTAEAIAFYNDYDNLVGTCTASSGGGCTVGDQFDGGEVNMHGLELTAATEMAAGAWRFPLEASYTYSDAEFRTAFSSGFDEWGTVESGDEVPYLPEHQLHLRAGAAFGRWRTDLTATYVGEMRVVAGSGDPAAGERVDDHWVVDVAGEVEVTNGVSLFARIENLLDEDYRVSRRPAGSRPGRPQTALAGVRVAF
ncbi:MAG: TonB-dependent receptor family protein, partial [Pseudomonadota bacterium]